MINMVVQKSLIINDTPGVIWITEKSFVFKQSELTTDINLEDILGFDHEPTNDTRYVTMHYICNKIDKLEKKTLTLKGKHEDLSQTVSTVKSVISKVSDRPKSIVIFLNPGGGSANSEYVFRKDVEPILKLASLKYNLIVSEGLDHLKEVASSYDFSPYDLLAIMGGDGTFNAFLNILLSRKKSEVCMDRNTSDHKSLLLDISVAFIPGGTGNSMAHIAYGGLGVESAVLHIIRGKTRPTSILGNYCNNKLVAYSFVMTATGMFVELIKSTDTQRWMRRLRYILVPAYFFLIKGRREIDVQLEFEEVLGPDGSVNSLETKETVVSAFLSHCDSLFSPVRETKEDCIAVTVYKPTSTWQMIKNVVALSSRRTRDEFEMNSSLKLKLAKGLTIKVDNPDPDIDYSLNIDGEVYSMSKPEVYVKLIPNAYKLITAKYATKEIVQ